MRARKGERLASWTVDELKHYLDSSQRCSSSWQETIYSSTQEQADEHGLAIARQAEEHHRVEEDKEHKSRKLPSQAQKHRASKQKQRVENPLYK